MTTGFVGGMVGGGAGPAPPATSFFQLSIQVAFNDYVWATSPTWTDVTRYAKSVTTTMGRQHELQQVNPSTAVISLVNEPVSPADPGGRFSPWNTNSPYYNSGNGLTPGHPVRVRATVAGTTYNVFYGYTQSWVPTYGQTSSSVTLNCYDALALLNLAMMDANLYEPQVIADGATAYWNCQDSGIGSTFADVTGNGHTGALVGSGSFGGSAGALLAIGDSCVTFDRAGLMATPITPPAAASVMFEGWFKTTGTDETLMSWGVGATAGNIYGMSLCLNGAGVPVLAYGTTDQVPPSSGTTLTGPFATNDGAWHHYVVKVPDTDPSYEWSLYVDGAFVGTAPNSSFVWTSGGFSFTAAGYWNENNAGGLGLVSQVSNFSGSMDQVAYYQTPLSAAQIAVHYQYGTAGFIVQDSGARAAAVLEGLAGVPSGLVNCDTGTVNVQGVTSPLNLTTAASYLLQVMNTERGLLYQDATGVVQFKNRHHVYTNSASTTSQITFTYHVGAGQYYLPTGLVPQEDDTDVWNDINVARQGGATQNAADATSISKYGRRSLQGYTSLLFEFDQDANDLAGGLLYQYKNPATRVRSLVTSSTINGASALPYVLALDLLDRITIVSKPIDGSTVDFNQQSLVEQITHNITPGQWDTTLAVTPIGTEQFFIIGDATNGKIGVSPLGF